MSLQHAANSLLSKIPAPDRKPTKAERTRAEILQAALEFFWSNPFRDLTIGALMGATSAGRSAFYQYFEDLYDLAETLLRGLEADILEVATPWFLGEGDPLPLLNESLEGLVRVSYERGPILKAVSDAAVSDERLEKEWSNFLSRFDDAVAARIEQQQATGLIAAFDARPVAIALNRMDASLLIEAFGNRPRSQPQPVLDAISRVWTCTLYTDIPSSSNFRIRTRRRKT
ncbi:MAG: TetR/AcrR family transcriptional regulator [Pirellulales bacterium]